VKSLLNILKFLLFFAVGFGLLWYTFRNQSLGDIYNKISHAHLGWVLASLVISTLALLSRSRRWNLLVEPLGYKPKLSSAFYSLMLGYFANLALPRLGEISRCGALSKAEKIPFNKLVGTVIVERVSDLLMLIVSIVVLSLAEYELLGDFLSEKIFGPLITGVRNSTLLIVIVVLVMALVFILMWKWLKSSSSGNLKQKVKNIITEVTEGLKSVFRMKNGYAFIGHTLFIWLMYFLMMYVSFFALEATSHLGMKAGLFVMVVGGIGMSAPVQGGIGTYHLLVSQGLMVYSINAEDGIAFATLVHTWQLILLIVLGTWSMIALFRKRKVAPES
jgi:glycosyltransferase 2 family protein